MNVYRRIPLATVVALLALCAVVAAPASAKSKAVRAPRSVSVLKLKFAHLRGASFIAGSGDVFVSGGVYPAGTGVLIDGSTGHRATISEPGCTPQFLGGRSLLFSCGPVTPTYKIYDIPTRQTRPLTLSPEINQVNACGHNPGQEDSACIPDGIGSHWVSIQDYCFEHCNRDLFQNLQTGAVTSDIASRTRSLDLNSPTLTVRLCNPVTDPAIPAPGAGENEFSREPVTLDGRFSIVGETPSFAGTGNPFLEECGTHLHESLPYHYDDHQYGPKFSDLAVNAHAIIWQSGLFELSGVMLPSRHRFRVSVPARVDPFAGSSTGSIVNMALTARTLYVFAGNGLWTAPAPRQ
jgi:hypothetical protein